MVTSNDLKKGMTILHKGVVHKIMDFQHIKPGKGPAFVRSKLKNLDTLSIFEHTFRAKESLEQAIVEKRTLQYIYRDKDMYYFMDTETYEQLPIDQKSIEHILDFLKEEMMVNFTFYKNRIIDSSLPDFMEFEVVEAQPGVKGNTVQGGTKPVTIDTGKVIQVPLFINQGDILKIDTRTGRYIERVNK